MLARIACLVAAVFALPASASLTVYTDRSAWESAVVRFVVDGYEDAFVTEVGGEVQIHSDWTTFRADNTCYPEDGCHGIYLATQMDGNKLLLGDIHDEEHGPSYNVLDLAFPTTAFAADVHYLEDGNWTVCTPSECSYYPFYLDPRYGGRITYADPPAFWGIVSDVPFRQIEFVHSYQGYAFDNVSLAVPEPATATLLAMGLAGLVGGRGRRGRARQRRAL